jgi:hypothetical protein
LIERDEVERDEVHRIQAILHLRSVIQKILHLRLSNLKDFDQGDRIQKYFRSVCIFVGLHALSTGMSITPLGDTYALLIVDCFFFFSPLVGGRLFMCGHANKRAAKGWVTWLST